MKALKILLLVALVVVGLGALLVGLAFTPPVQKRVFLAVANADGRTISVDRVSASLSGVELTNPDWNQNGMTVAAKSIRVVTPVLALLGSNRVIDIEELAIAGLRVDIREATPAAAASAPEGVAKAAPAQPAEASQGIVLKLPAAVSIARVSIDGEVTLPDAGAGRPHGRVSITGGNFAPGSEGTLKISGDWTDPAQAALSAGVAIDGEITVRQSALREIERIGFRLNSPLVSGTGTLDAPGGALTKAVAAMDLTADLGKLVAFVPAASRPPLTNGRLAQNLKLTQEAGGVLRAEGNTVLENLAGTAEGASMERLAIVWSALAPESKPITITAAIELAQDSARPVSKLALNGTIEPTGGTTRLDLTAHAARVAAPEMMPVSDLALPPSDPEKPDEVPAWAGLTGEIRFALDEVVLSEDTSMRNVKGTVVITDDKLTISGLEGVAFESPFRGNVTLAFSRASGGYSLESDVALDRFDIGRALEALQPGKTPQLEGVFATKANVRAAGMNFSKLAAAPAASVSVHGTEGVFRGLKRTAGTTSSIAGLLGSLTKSKELAGVSELATALERIPFEELTLDATAGADKSVDVATFRLRAANLILEGSGNLKPSEGASFLQWPLGLQLQLAGRGRVAQLLESMHIAAAQPDASGYTPLRFPFKLAGSLATPDAGDLWKSISQTAVSTLLEPKRTTTSETAPTEPVPPPAQP